VAKDRDKVRAYMREYNQRNRAKNLQYERDRYQKDPERFKAKARAYRKANPEKVAAQQASYRQRNQERLAIQKRLRPRDAGRLRESHVRRKYRLTPELVARQLASQGNACAICRASFAEVEQHIDHQHGGDVRVLEVQRGSRAVWR